ncbi:Putative cytochrome P450 E-class, group I [Podospora comata]|uniref:Cytochrome P450 E-class, group I n=1 Tax=Podospora comata TaxID=48703 RepID=A0ABY6SFU8_PODCO|nr:Putative cytochrome P450 E-class, group I [Podospora comata]
MSFAPKTKMDLLLDKRLTLSWTLAIQILLATITSIIIYRRHLHPLSSIPGPPFASISRLWHIYHILKGDQNLQLVSLHNKYGHFVRLAHNEVSVSHPDAVKKILGSQLKKGPWYRMTAIPDYRFQSPMATTDPKKKMEKSKAFASGYALTNVLRSEPQLDNVISLLLGHLDGFARTGKEVGLDKYFTFTSFDVAGEILFSSQFGFLETGTDVGNAIANGYWLSMYASAMAFFYHIHVALLGNPFITWLNILPYGHLFDTTIKAMKARLQDKRDESRFDSVEYWFRAMEKHPEKIKWRDVQAVTVSTVGAASETVSCALQSFVYYMIRTAGAWERARKEVIELQEKEGGREERVVSWGQAKRLVYLQACLKEGLRMFAPVPMNLPRVVGPEGLEIGGRRFEKGSILSVNSWVMHFSDEIWGEDAGEFKPERWLREDAGELDRWFMPWGYGYNSCPGQNIARLELSKIAATLVRDYDISQVNPEQEWKWQAFFTVVQHSWPCYIKARKTTTNESGCKVPLH